MKRLLKQAAKIAKEKQITVYVSDHPSYEGCQLFTDDAPQAGFDFPYGETLTIFEVSCLEEGEKPCDSDDYEIIKNVWVHEDETFMD